MGLRWIAKIFILIWLSLIQAHIKMEAYGYAIADATKALELDPTNVKVYTIAHSTSRSLSF